MGQRGPPPTPTRLLERRGSWRAQLRRHEPRPAPGAPRIPDWLPAPARLNWKRLVSRLGAVRVLTNLDGNALGRYCVLFERWRKTEEFLEKHGDSHLVKDAAGTVKGVRLYPQAKLSAQLAEQLLRLESHFGLTPASRVRIEVSCELAEEDDADSRFFKVC